MIPEEKLFEKIRRVLIDDSTIKGYVQDRVYAAHVSTINNPVYPCISLHLIDAAPRFSVPDASNIRVQIDLWFPSKDYIVDDLKSCFERVRALLNRQNLSDTSLSLKVGQIYEEGMAPVMFEEDTQLYHLPARYSAVAI